MNYTAKLKDDEKWPCPHEAIGGGWDAARGKWVMIREIGGPDKLHPEDQCGASQYFLVDPIPELVILCGHQPEDLNKLCVCDHVVDFNTLKGQDENNDYRSSPRN